MSRRSKLEIHLCVLQIIKSGTSKPTRIMYEANLSWDHLNRVLGLLKKQRLVEEVDTSGSRRRDKRTNRKYLLTQEGENVVRYFLGSKALGIKDLSFLGAPLGK